MSLISATAHFCRVFKFMAGCGQKVATKPVIPDTDTRKLRARLILEEALETCDALGIKVTVGRSRTDLSTKKNYSKLVFTDAKEPDLVGIVDGCCDIRYVTTGTLVSCGVSDGPVQREVDENNLLKLKNGRIDEHGKLIKAPDHPAPDIAGKIGQ